MQLESIDAESLYNALQARKIWPSGGPPVLFDVRPADAYATRHLRAAHGVSLADGELLGAPPPESFAAPAYAVGCARRQGPCAASLGVRGDARLADVR